MSACFLLPSIIVLDAITAKTTFHEHHHLITPTAATATTMFLQLQQRCSPRFFVWVVVTWGSSLLESFW
jgi:hypothetical protein